MAEWWLPRRLFAQRPGPSPALSARPDRKVIVVTFGGGVRYEDSLAPSGWVNIPHLAKELVPQGLVYPTARYDGITGHFNSTGALVTGCRQEVDAYGSEAPVTPTIFELFRKQQTAARGSLGHRHQQELQPDGRQQAARLRRPVLGQRHPAEAAPHRDDQVGGEHRRRARRRGSVRAGRTDDAGPRRRLRRLRLEGLRGRPRPRPRAEGDAGQVAARLLQRPDGADQRRRADLFHDQGDHEPGGAVARRRQFLGHRHRPLRRLLALPRSDPAHRSPHPRAVEARAVAAGLPGQGVVAVGRAGHGDRLGGVSRGSACGR